MRKRVIFHDLIMPEEAVERIKRYIKLEPLGKEEVGLLEAVGRVLAEDVYSGVDVPPFDRATMDGYAVRAEDTFGAFDDRPRRLKVVGRVEAGNIPGVEVKEGEAVEIATGAPMPKGSDAVVPVEFTKREGGEVVLYNAVVPGENVLSAGYDVSLGDLVLRKGTVLWEREIAVLAAIGKKKVPVVKRPKVGIISSGNELVEPGEKLGLGMIYDVNTYSLSSAVKEDSGLPISYGIVRDNFEEMRGRILEAVGECDIVLVSGGTSAGLADMTYSVLEELGPPGIIVHGLKVKPGKPTVISVSKEGKLIFGLPGYPNSALMIYDQVVRPIIRELSGIGATGRPIVKARLAKRMEGARGRRGHFPVNLIMSKEGLLAFPLPAESGMVSSLALSDGYVTIPENMEYLDEKEEVLVRLFSTHYSPAGLYFIGSHDIMIGRLLGKDVKVVNVGSLEGVKAIAKGIGDIAGIHLIDPDSMSYNIPYLERMGVKNARLVAGYEREMGIIVQKGNPKGIRTVSDLLREDVTIVNRPPGSGTRVLLDHLLEKLGKGSRKEVKGYSTIVKTHSAVAAAVKAKRADAGIGIKYYASMYGLDFIPLGWEKYDFLIREESVGKLKEFFGRLESPEFASQLRNTPGYRPSGNIGKVVWKG